MNVIGSCSQRPYDMVGAMACAKMIKCEAKKIGASSEEAEVKGCGCLGGGEASASWKAHEGRGF